LSITVGLTPATSGKILMYNSRVGLYRRRLSVHQLQSFRLVMGHSIESKYQLYLYDIVFYQIVKLHIEVFDI